jgi:hypothetical protein
MDANVLGRALAYWRVGLPFLKLPSGGMGALAAMDLATMKFVLDAAFFRAEDVLVSSARVVYRRLYSQQRKIH